MMKLISGQSKWLAVLIILSVIALGFGGCPPSNQLPVISNLAVNSEGEINPGGSCQIECAASDPDGDELSYTWSADGGDIIGEGPTVTWIAPDAPGAYTITVEVTDGRDGEATKQLTIDVLAPNNPPVIEVVTAKYPRLKKASNTPITCYATDPDGDKLTYTWSADAGNITGEGDTITWVAPNDYGTYTITLTVTDGRGGEASESVDIIVCSCPSAH